MDRMLATVEILRRRLRFRGYVHLKIVPGAGADQVERAIALATRVSVNLEAPTARHLAELAPRRRSRLRSCARCARWRGDGGGPLPSLRPDHAAGGGRERRERPRDRPRLGLALSQPPLARVYYSAFQPSRDSARAPPRPLLREHRLYQMDFLLRSTASPSTSSSSTPRSALPREGPEERLGGAPPERFPLEINRAPSRSCSGSGIGPRSAKRILERRREGPLRRIESLRGTGVALAHARGYLLSTAGVSRPSSRCSDLERRRARARPRRDATPLAQGPAPGMGQYYEVRRELGRSASTPSARGALPERRGVLGRRHRDLHDPRRGLHPRLSLLRGPQRPPRGPPSSTSRIASPRRPCASGSATS